MTDFDPDFAGPAEYAAFYRASGIQVVPAKTPSESKAWKRPALNSWRDLEHGLTDDKTFDAWYGPGGEHLHRSNLGIITGTASGGIWVLDADTQKTSQAQQWLNGLLVVNNNGMEFETATQRTGGGGYQFLFRAPEGWTPPTCKTAIGIDIRGQGGFAVLPPSMHESGTAYDWLPGKEPWEVGIAMAPNWLVAAVDALTAQFGGRQSSASPDLLERTPSPAQATNAFGLLVDGREDYMTRLVWAKVVSLYRDSPINMGPDGFKAEMRDAFNQYERNAKSRIFEPGTPNHILLEREGRGISLFQSKWQIALKQWDSKVKDWATKPPPQKSAADFPTNGGLPPPLPRHDPETGEILDDVVVEASHEDVYETLDVKQIKALPDPVWLIENTIIDQSLAIIYGAPGTGKSFLALDMGLKIASGGEWLNRKVLKNGPIVYISSEGTGDIKFRIQAWENGNGVKTDSLPFYLIRQTINFMAEEDVNRLLRTVQKISHNVGTPAMVFVDTVSRVLPGADENLQKDMTLFIKACDQVRETFKTTVVGVHHTSRGGNLRGSTVFDGAGDTILCVEKEEGAETGEVIAKKIKAAQDGWRQAFRFKKVGVGDIKGTESLVPYATISAPKMADQWPSRGVCEAIVLEMEKAWLNRKPWSPAPQTRAEARYAPSRMSEWKIPEDLAKKMLEAWVRDKLIDLVTYDTSAKKKGYQVISTVTRWYDTKVEKAPATYEND